MNPITDQIAGDERLLLLAMALDTRVGLTFDQIAGQGFLGDPSKAQIDSLRRNFNSYRRQLEEIGICTVETNWGGTPRYRLDTRVTFADPHDIRLSHDEALELVGLLTIYLENENAPYASDVRKARDKIAAVAGLAYAVNAARPQRDSSANTGKAHAASAEKDLYERALDMLLACFADQRPVQFCYTNAEGQTERRTICIYGVFERHAKTYFVGRDDTKGAGEDNPVKVFRNDRIDARSVTVNNRGTYSIPVDFSVNDYMRLPFQYGAQEPFVATFCAKSGMSESDRMRITSSKGSWERDENGCFTWNIEANDLRALAQWAAGALSEGLMPLKPPVLIDAMAHGIDRSEKTHG